jgi:very-short-patch-repair endonuclease
MRFCGISCYMKSTAETTIEAAVRRWLEANGIAYIAQHNIGRYHVDFYIPDSGTVIEADGDYWHAIPSVAAKDVRKEAWLIANGYEVVRLAEHEIRADVDAVIRRRWTRYAREAGIDAGSGALDG